MKIPNNYTEQEVFNIIDKVCKRLAPRYTFTVYDEEDIYQEAFMLGIDALERYDPQYNLSTFIFGHINNRLKTFKRDNDYRLEEGASKNLQQIKKKINSPAGYNEELVSNENEEDNIFYKDLIGIIDEELPANYRGDFLRLVSGESIPQSRKNSLLDIMRTILKVEEVEEDVE